MKDFVRVPCMKINVVCTLFSNLSTQPDDFFVKINSLSPSSVYYCVTKELLVIFASNLDETTRSVYKENVRVNVALEYHMTESKDLKKVCKHSVHYIYFIFYICLQS